MRKVDDKRNGVLGTSGLVGNGDDRLMQFLLIELCDHCQLLRVQSDMTMDRIDTDSRDKRRQDSLIKLASLSFLIQVLKCLVGD